ncbi:MAG: hypothetical protein GY906_18890 [bacterium]|nr:hypothetical protein [bacterium]
MKILMIIVESECREELEVLLDRHNVDGYTEIPGAHGVGTSGIRMGSGAFPKTSSVFFTIIDEDQLAAIKADITNYCEACGKKMRMAVWGIEEAF